MRSVDLTKRRVWITGASSGIGRAVALEFGRRGCSLALSARSKEALEKLASEFGSARTCVVPLDITDRTANLAVAERIRSCLGGLDIAFLNAGTCEYVDVRNFDSDLFERVMRTNFMGMVYGVEAALPLLRESRHPQLVGMSSTLAYGPLPRAEAYGASKAAIRYLLEGLRIDLAAEHIPVSVVCPGFVKTPLTDRNDFPMPCLIGVEEAARRIVDGVAAQTAEIHFPKRFSLTYKLIAMLPSRLYAKLIGSFIGP